MKRYLYNYQTVVTFSQPIANHYLLLRCQPMSGTYMRIDEEHLIVSPGYRVCRGIDAFGNRLVYGGQREEHTTLAYVSTGIVEMSQYVSRTDRGISPMYLVDTPLTMLDLGQAAAWLETSRGLFPSKDTGQAEKAMAICHHVYGIMSYMPLTTTVDTPAKEIFNVRRGVCQDYAHLMIALCRLCSIPARYVCGFVEGTGETHAWVEIHDGYSWLGFDPTNDRRITYGYVKLAHGRDASDCPVNRGVYLGNATQQNIVGVTLVEL
ncbi:MAG: transglutaminase domain-containing protein [Prevotella sp.]